MPGQDNQTLGTLPGTKAKPKKKTAPKKKPARKVAAKKKPAARKAKKGTNRHGRKGHSEPVIFWLTKPQKKALVSRCKKAGITMAEHFRRIAKLPKSPGDK